MHTKAYLILVALLKKTNYNAKIREIESKIHNVSDLAATSPLTTVENKILTLVI